jgi:alpha-L-fucosidase 2
MPRVYDWDFPLPRTHTGVLLGNGTFGLIVWGEGRRLRLTLGRADFWDHRGGMPWTEEQSYANIRACLEKGDEAGLRRLFESTPSQQGTPARPTVLPVGRFDLDFGPGARLLQARLDLGRGELSVSLRCKGAVHRIAIQLATDKALAWLRLPAALKGIKLETVPAWEYVGGELDQVGFDPPELFDRKNVDKSIGGWVQNRPADPALAVGYRRQGRDLLLATAYASASAGARKNVTGLLERSYSRGYDALQKHNRSWWAEYWSDVPRFELPNPHLRFLYDYGMYKFSGLTAPQGTAATLQGPWIEEYQLPPWSSDYHFNINVQMCYWPAFHGNRLQHLRPLFDMIGSWMPVLRHNARVFLGIEDGVMLPHAVDDRGTCMGGFWTGSVDHGCTAWVAQMMYRYYRYSGDVDFLRHTAYPFMQGAMRVYEEMLESDGDSWTLPLSVSPEYRGAAMDAWGRDASFQLACIHRLCADLLDAAAVLGRRPKKLWRRLLDKVPLACLEGKEGHEQIALWQGTVLEESHRHHSHLAGITPFDTLDLDDPQWRQIVDASLRQWIRLGPGLWSGWCVPWASMIHTRAGNADAAEMWLEIWQRLFTNQGGGTLHDVDFAGFSLMGRGPRDNTPKVREVMQIEAGMSCVAAIQEMLLHVRGGVNYLFVGAPRSWKKVGFSGMRTDGAFLVSARRVDGRVRQVEVESLIGGVFLLANPWGEDVGVQVQRKTLASKTGKGKSYEGGVLSVETQRGEQLTIKPV